MTATFQQIGLHYLIKALIHVDRNVIDMILNRMTMDRFNLTFHILAIALGNLLRIDFQSSFALHINKITRFITERQIEFLLAMEGMEEHDFVLAMAQMPKGIKESLVLFGTDKCIGKYNHKRPAMEFLGQQMDTGRNRGWFLLHLVRLDRKQLFFEQGIKITLVGSR